MELTEIASGKFFAHLTRPIGAPASQPFRVRFETVSVVDARSNHQVGPHVHPHYELLYVDAGTYRAIINQGEISVAPGHLVVIKPGDHHSDLCPDPVRLRVVRLRVDPGPSVDRSRNLLAEDLSPTAQVAEDPDSVFSDLITRVIDEAASHRRFAAEILDCLATELMWSVLRRKPNERLESALAASGSDRGFAADLQRVFEAHRSDNLGLHELAQRLHVSERTLSARCRGLFGDSPTRLFVRHKMEQARVLVAQTDLPIKEISAHFGFENPYHFSTVYKRVHGVAPSAHRG